MNGFSIVVYVYMESVVCASSWAAIRSIRRSYCTKGKKNGTVLELLEMGELGSNAGRRLLRRGCGRMLDTRGVKQGWSAFAFVFAISVMGDETGSILLRFVRPVARRGDGARENVTIGLVHFSMEGMPSTLLLDALLETLLFLLMASSSSSVLVNDTSAAPSLGLLVVDQESAEMVIRETLSRILAVMSSTRRFADEELEYCENGNDSGNAGTGTGLLSLCI